MKIAIFTASLGLCLASVAHALPEHIPHDSNHPGGLPVLKIIKVFHNSHSPGQKTLRFAAGSMVLEFGFAQIRLFGLDKSTGKLKTDWDKDNFSLDDLPQMIPLVRNQLSGLQAAPYTLTIEGKIEYRDSTSDNVVSTRDFKISVAEADLRAWGAASGSKDPLTLLAEVNLSTMKQAVLSRFPAETDVQEFDGVVREFECHRTTGKIERIAAIPSAEYIAKKFSARMTERPNDLVDGLAPPNATENVTTPWIVKSAMVNGPKNEARECFIP